MSIYSYHPQKHHSNNNLIVYDGDKRNANCIDNNYESENKPLSELDHAKAESNCNKCQSSISSGSETSSVSIEFECNMQNKRINKRNKLSKGVKLSGVRYDKSNQGYNQNNYSLKLEELKKNLSSNLPRGSKKPLFVYKNGVPFQKLPTCKSEYSMNKINDKLINLLDHNNYMVNNNYDKTRASMQLDDKCNNDLMITTEFNDDGDETSTEKKINCLQNRNTAKSKTYSNLKHIFHNNLKLFKTKQNGFLKIAKNMTDSKMQASNEQLNEPDNSSEETPNIQQTSKLKSFQWSENNIGKPFIATNSDLIRSKKKTVGNRSKPDKKNELFNKEINKAIKESLEEPNLNMKSGNIDKYLLPYQPIIPITTYSACSRTSPLVPAYVCRYCGLVKNSCDNDMSAGFSCPMCAPHWIKKSKVVRHSPKSKRNVKEGPNRVHIYGRTGGIRKQKNLSDKVPRRTVPSSTTETPSMLSDNVLKNRNKPVIIKTKEKQSPKNIPTEHEQSPNSEQGSKCISRPKICPKSKPKKQKTNLVEKPMEENFVQISKTPQRKIDPVSQTRESDLFPSKRPRETKLVSFPEGNHYNSPRYHLQSPHKDDVANKGYATLTIRCITPISVNVRPLNDKCNKYSRSEPANCATSIQTDKNNIAHSINHSNKIGILLKSAMRSLKRREVPNCTSECDCSSCELCSCCSSSSSSSLCHSQCSSSALCHSQCSQSSFCDSVY